MWPPFGGHLFYDLSYRAWGWGRAWPHHSPNPLLVSIKEPLLLSIKKKIKCTPHKNRDVDGTGERSLFY